VRHAGVGAAPPPPGCSRWPRPPAKRNAGLAVITQDAADVLGSDLGQAVIANAATQILIRQAPQAIDQVTAALT
jgi:type IV secretory pathway VirB4 component